MDRIERAIVAVFPDLGGAEIKPGLRFEQIPGYDSMNAINLHLALQQEFGREFEMDDLPLDGSNSVRELAARLREKGLELE